MKTRFGSEGAFVEGEPRIEYLIGGVLCIALPIIVFLIQHFLGCT